MLRKKMMTGFVMAVAMTASLLVVAPVPASAASVCTFVRTEGLYVQVNGAIRQATGIGTQWTFNTTDSCRDSFAWGGIMHLRRLTLQNGSTGGCTTSISNTSVWVQFTGVNQSYNYGGLGNGQCFRMQGKAMNANATYYNFYGRLIY